MKSLMTVFASLALMLPSLAIAGPVISGSVPTRNSPTGAAPLGGPASNSYAPTTFQAPTVSKTQGIENNGKDASKKQGNGSGTAMIVAGVMAGMAAMSCPTCYSKGANCPMCIGALAGAAASLLTAKKMDKAQGTSNTQVADVNPMAEAIGPGAEAGNLEQTPQYQTAVRNLKTAARSMNARVASDGTKITLADGTELDPTKPMPKGIPQPSSSDQAKINSAISKALAKADEAKGADGAASIAEVNEEGEGGGGGIRTSVSALTDESAKLAAAGSGREPSSVAGLSKDYNGEQIGVAQDSIFGMLHRRYQLHNNQSSFLPAK